ncbi:MAG: OmpH family outer membrane protein [Limnohabitans sp.]|nr:OmpH family outer membrane protein [Limnohabitans sp.]
MMKQLKTLLIAGLLFFGASQVNAQSKIAHIDVQDLLAKMPDMVSAKAQIKTLSDKFDTQYKAMVEEYQTKMKKYESEAPTAGDALNETRGKEMQDMGQRIQQFRDSAQKQLSDKEMELVKPIMERAKTAVVKVGKAKGFQYVVDASTLILADGPDIMEDVKKELATPAPKK